MVIAQNGKFHQISISDILNFGGRPDFNLIILNHFDGRTCKHSTQRTDSVCFWVIGRFQSLFSPNFVDLLSQEWEERRKDKLNYRYPGVGGESYQVLTTQLEHETLRRVQLQI